MAANITDAGGSGETVSDAVFIGLFVGLFLLPPCCFGIARLFKLLKHMRGERHGRIKGRAVQVDDSTRARLFIFLYVRTRIGASWDIVQATLALLSCIHYIIGTYTASCNVFSKEVDTAIEFTVFAAFAIDYCLAMYLARDRLWFVVSPVALADLLSILPTLLQVALWTIQGHEVGCDADSFYFAKFVRLIRIMRLLRMFRVVRLTSRTYSSADNVYSQLAHVGTIVLSLILVAACLFQWAETFEGENELDFHVALYYMIIEVCGRPKLEINTVQGYLIASAVVILVVVVIPFMVRHA